MTKYNLSLAIVVCLILLLASARGSNARLISVHSNTKPKPIKQILTYHGGPLLTNSSTLNVYLIYYGRFSSNDKVVIRDFFASFNPSNVTQKAQPTVTKWWQTIKYYKDKSNGSVPGAVRLAKQLGDQYSLGTKNIKRAQIADLVQDKVEKQTLPLDPGGVYLVLTSKDVTVERFCMSSCGFHATARKPPGSLKRGLVVGHVGDSSLQCPGFCAWPYAAPTYAKPFKPFPAPNGVGVDGMVVNIATVLGGAVTNPFGDGYYQGDAQTPVEAVSACSGKFGAGAFPGFPGELLSDKGTNVTYNAYGANGRKFLLPAMWDPAGSTCKAA